MKEILMEHFRRYPAMEAADAVKLLYQSEFGGGHMIANPQKSLDFLKQEWERVKMQENRRCLSAPFENIGGGMYRLDLAALDEGLLPETCNQMFVQTADRKVGTRESFEKKLDMLTECCERGEIPLDSETVREYLEEYRKQGYPAVSHSSGYRQKYHPAYRVVSECFVRYYDVFRRIDRALAEKQSGPVLVAVDGMCGSGKSTLGRILQSVYGCSLFHLDDFFLRPEQRTKERLAQAGGNVDYERFQEEILSHVEDPNGLEYRVYSCAKQDFGETVYAPYNRLCVAEGSYSQHPYFGNVWDLRFFCEIDGEEQMRRIRLRSGEAMAVRFRDEWIPRENAYFAAFGIREKSVMVTGDGRTGTV